MEDVETVLLLASIAGTNFNMVFVLSDEIKDLNTTKEIVEYLKETTEIKLCVQEVGSMSTFDYQFNK